MGNKVQKSSGPRPEKEYLVMLGERVRQERARRDMTRKTLAKFAAVSERFLAQLETGHGNISILRLRRISNALGVPLERLTEETGVDRADLTDAIRLLEKLQPEQRRRAHQMLLEKFGAHSRNGKKERIALIGLRGAGKSTLGAALAERLGVPFIELDRKVEQESGVMLSVVFDLYGPAGFHRLEREALENVLEKHERFVLATGGSLVNEPEIFSRLQNACYTVWLKAKPEDHMQRVLAQGDRRPMAGNQWAMADLRKILAGREPLYARAAATVETSGKSVKQVLGELAIAVKAAK